MTKSEGVLPQAVIGDVTTPELNAEERQALMVIGISNDLVAKGLDNCTNVYDADAIQLATHYGGILRIMCEGSLVRRWLDRKIGKWWTAEQCKRIIEHIEAIHGREGWELRFAISLLKFKRTTVRYMRTMFPDKYNFDPLEAARKDPKAVLEMINQEKSQEEWLEN